MREGVCHPPVKFHPPVVARRWWGVPTTRISSWRIDTTPGLLRSNLILSSLAGDNSETGYCQELLNMTGNFAPLTRLPA